MLLAAADILIHDLRTDERASLDLDEQTLSLRYPKLIDVSVLPFGAVGPKAGWQGEEINLIHASGEGFLLPNGLAAELFPDRPPIKVYGHFAEYQGGVVAALGALSALIGREQGGAESVDVSVQDAALAVGAFALQRLGDGSLEHRHTRSFKYGGVLECADGYVELLTLEERQWRGLVELMGRPDWMLDPALADSLERSRRGAEINRAIRAWALEQQTADVVARAQALGVPMIRRAGVTRLMLPKAEPGALNRVVGLLDRPCQIIALIETVRGYAELRSIGKSGLVSQLAFGNLDFGIDAGVTETAQELDPVRLQIVLESRLAGLAPPIDGVTTSWTDAAAFGAAVGRAKALGFGAKLCIHPAQVKPVNDAFLPTADELDWARRVMEVAKAGAAVALDGKMIDAPVIRRAELILAGEVRIAT